MESLLDFRKRVNDTLDAIHYEVLEYNEDEFWMIRSSYEFLEYYAEKHRMFNTAIALPLARGLHNGTYRKLPIVRGGVSHKPPYVIHCLTVCKMLADMWLPMEDEEKDILLAAALCHDMIEDMNFRFGGEELVTEFYLDQRVLDTVRLVSKRKDFTPEQEKAFFHGIESNKLACLVKLSDRGHNVTDLYNMSAQKIQEYIEETRTYFIPMCDYARIHYPELAEVAEIMQDQLISLTKTVEMLSYKYNLRKVELEDSLESLRAENESLRRVLKKAKEGMHA